MLRYALRRAMQSLLTVFGVLTVVFFLVHFSGDPAALLLPMEATAADVARLHAALGLDRPLPVQYGSFLWRAAQGDLGLSLHQHTDALGLVLERIPATLELALTSFGLGIVLAFAGGLAAEISGSRRLKAFLLWIALIRQAIPVFWFGLLMILLFSVELGWLPSLGRGGLSHLVLPAITLATYQFGLYLRLFDAAMGHERGQDYVRTAYAKGQRRAAVTLRHMLPNALLPLVTLAGIDLGVLLGGAVVTETVFSWPGVGRLVVMAVSQRDYPVVIAGVLAICVVFVVANLLIDLIYGMLDPRVRLA